MARVQGAAVALQVIVLRSEQQIGAGHLTYGLDSMQPANRESPLFFEEWTTEAPAVELGRQGLRKFVQARGSARRVQAAGPPGFGSI